MEYEREEGKVPTIGDMNIKGFLFPSLPLRKSHAIESLWKKMKYEKKL